MRGRGVLWTACFVAVASVLVMFAGTGCERTDNRERTYYKGIQEWCVPGACPKQTKIFFVDAFDRVWPGVYPIPRGYDDDTWESQGDPGYTITTEGGPKGFTVVVYAPSQTMTWKGSVSGDTMSGTFHVDAPGAGSGDGTFDFKKDSSKS
ncbi:MAG: hypothetical protein HQ559_17980 [Lentisphaerae bacterium]|nr:hypothetical protein [Lentisphaerota bacterium]